MPLFDIRTEQGRQQALAWCEAFVKQYLTTEIKRFLKDYLMKTNITRHDRVLNGPPTQSDYERVVDEAATLRMFKVMAYGEDRYETPLGDHSRKHDLTMTYSDVYRKFIRIKEAVLNDKHEMDDGEFLRDAFLDLANYALMGTQLCDKHGLGKSANPAQYPANRSEISDGFHTFGELYDYRRAYNAALFNTWAMFDAYNVHKSRLHHDGEPCFGGEYFVVVAHLPTGQISNHYKLAHWDDFCVEERERAATWDGHTPAEALARMQRFLVIQETDGKGNLTRTNHKSSKTQPGYCLDQIAISSPDPDATKALLDQIFGRLEWSDDHVVAVGEVFGVSGHNAADLSFNYTLVKGNTEFEILSYTQLNGEIGSSNWLESSKQPARVVSHFGMHVEDVQPWKEKMYALGFTIAQEVVTNGHTNPKISDNRRYHYVIFDTRERLGFDLKLIQRLDWEASNDEPDPEDYIGTAPKTRLRPNSEETCPTSNLPRSQCDCRGCYGVVNLGGA